MGRRRLDVGYRDSSGASRQPSQPPDAAAAQPPHKHTDSDHASGDACPAEDLGTDLRLNVTTYVEVPVTVKDSKGKLVPGLTWRDFRVFENGAYEPLKEFSVDPFPLSIAFVIDQSLTSDVMDRVNDSLDAIQGALTPYDEIAVFTYSNGSQERTGFTGAQSARVPAVLALTEGDGQRKRMIPDQQRPDGRLQRARERQLRRPEPAGGALGGQRQRVITIPKEIHTLNDAILAAAKELSTRPKGRRRIIYVISDGKEVRQQGQATGMCCAICRPTTLRCGARWWAIRPAGAKATSAASTCRSRCTTTCW